MSDRLGIADLIDSYAVAVDLACRRQIGAGRGGHQVASIKKEIHIDRPPEAVWAIVGNVGSMEWVPGVIGSTIDGNIRTCDVSEGAVLKEQILSIDETARYYEYTIVESRLPISFYRASMKVTDDGIGSRFIWTAEIEPADLGPMIEAALRGGAQALKARLEG